MENIEDKNNDRAVQEVLGENEVQENFSSLDLLWQHVFRELDHWAKRAEFRDEVFMKEAASFVESIQRNQGNMRDIIEQFNKELIKWEMTAREEFLMSTTAIQHIFPKVSYEEINQQIDKIQQKIVSLLNTPIQVITNGQKMDQYITMIEQYIDIRKNARKQYIKTVKQAGNLIYESQKGFVDIFTRQMKAFMFPLNKYMEKTEV